jgi:hypothetical protein
LPPTCHDHSSNHRWLSNGSGPECVIEVTRPYVSNSHIAVQRSFGFQTVGPLPVSNPCLTNPVNAANSALSTRSVSA